MLATILLIEEEVLLIQLTRRESHKQCLRANVDRPNPSISVLPIFLPTLLGCVANSSYGYAGFRNAYGTIWAFLVAIA